MPAGLQGQLFSVFSLSRTQTGCAGLSGTDWVDPGPLLPAGPPRPAGLWGCLIVCQGLAVPAGVTALGRQGSLAAETGSPSLHVSLSAGRPEPFPGTSPGRCPLWGAAERRTREGGAATGQRSGEGSNAVFRLLGLVLQAGREWVDTSGSLSC